MLDPVANFADSTVATAPSPATSGTSVVLASAATFLDPATYGPYNVTVFPQFEQPSSTNSEIWRVTAKSTNTLTITRVQEGSSARTVIIGDRVVLECIHTVTKDHHVPIHHDIHPPGNGREGAS